MPHVRLEYTDNLKEYIEVKTILPQFHRILSEIGGINIENCKSRAIELDRYFIGSGDAENAFIHLEVRILEGRSTELKQQIGTALLTYLHSVMEETVKRFDLQITVEIIDILKSCYFKYPEGTLHQSK